MKNYKEGKSYLTISLKKCQDLIDNYAANGIIKRDLKGNWIHKEFITLDKNIGVHIDIETKEETMTNTFFIAYSKKEGVHIIPARREK